MDRIGDTYTRYAMVDRSAEDDETVWRSPLRSSFASGEEAGKRESKWAYRRLKKPSTSKSKDQ